MADDVVINIRERGSRQTARQVGTISTGLDRLGKRGRAAAGGVRLFSRATTSASSGLHLMAGAAVTGGAALGGAFVIGAKKAVDVASDVNESTTKNIRLFGRYAASVDRFSRTSATSLGISRREALAATGTFGNLFTALNIGPKRSARMSVSLTKLASDLASFNNTSPEDALEAIRSGLVGETEPLRKYGVNIQDATLRTQALRMHLISSTKDALSPQNKALAANALIFRQTRKAQGDFGRTSEGLANQQRILRANVDDLEGSLGAALLPTVNRAVRSINRDAIPAFRGLGKDIDRISKSGATSEMKIEMGREAIRKRLGPLEHQLTAAIRRMKLGDAAGDAIEAGAPAIGRAMGNAAPVAGRAFWGAFKSSGPAGQAAFITMLGAKFGGFQALGGAIGGLLSRGIGGKITGKAGAVPVWVVNQGGMPGAAGKGKGKGKGPGRLARIGRGAAAAVAGEAALTGGVAAIPGLAVAGSIYAGTLPPNAESGNPEGVRAHGPAAPRGSYGDRHYGRGRVHPVSSGAFRPIILHAYLQAPNGKILAKTILHAANDAHAARKGF